MKKEIEFAIQQFVGYGHASKGYNIEQLIGGMGLKRKEFEEIREDVRAWLPASDFAEVVEYFAKGKDK